MIEIKNDTEATLMLEALTHYMRNKIIVAAGGTARPFPPTPKSLDEIPGHILLKPAIDSDKD